MAMIEAGGQEAGEGRWDPNLIMLLSLQLLLLVFFILLVSQSKFEPARVHSAISSVQRAFSSILPDVEGELAAGVSDTEVLRYLHDRVGQLAAAFVPMTQTASPGSGDRFTIRLPARALVREGEAKVTPAGRRFLRRLAETLLELAPRLRLETAIMVDRSAPDAVAASGALLRVLIGAGVPADQVVAGLGDPGLDDIDVTIVVAPRPSVAPASQVGAVP
jgi:hypothetical protein